MKFGLLLPKFHKSLLSFRLDDIFKGERWKKWSLRDSIFHKKWRAILNDRARNRPFQNEEFVLITESRFGGSSHLVRLISGGETKLKTRNGKVNILEHSLIIDRNHDHDAILHLKNVPYRMERPSLEDYILYMKRIATPSYPKDIQAMLSLAEIRTGSCVIEAGTGSGALTLFLSRTVGNEGHVHSFDSNEKHMNKAKENLANWIHSWNKTKSPHWPQNVTFHDVSIKKCVEHLPPLTGGDAVFLDLQSPENFLEFLIPVMKQGSPVVIFLPSITQIVDVVSSCNTNKLPFHVESVIEVMHRMWKIQAVTPLNTDVEDNPLCSEDQRSGDEIMPSLKYAAKPSFQQLPHTGFILKLLLRR